MGLSLGNEVGLFRQSPGSLHVLHGQALHVVFRLIRQVTEEIQTRERFQLVDVHHVASQVLVPVRLVFKPETQGLISSTVLHQQGAKEILGLSRNLVGINL